MRINSIGRLTALSLALMSCSGEKLEKTAEPIAEERLGTSEQVVNIIDGFDGETLESAHREGGFKALVPLLAVYKDGMYPINQKRFENVLTLLDDNLRSLNVEYTDELSKEDGAAGTKRAITSFSLDQKSPEPPTIKLSKDWSASSGMDLLFLVHELNHADEIQKAKKNIDEVEWSILFNSPGNGIEVRTELRAWDLTLDLADQISQGAFTAFVDDALANSSDQTSADLILAKYVTQIGNDLNIEINRSGQLKQWLQLTFFLQRAKKMDNLDCRWGYGFVSTIAEMYHAAGSQIYEVENSSQGPHTEQCIYPLDGGPYKAAWIYGEMPSGVTGPLKRISFNLPPDH